MNDRTSPPAFPCRELPADAGAARLLGLYPQRQAGLWVQRVKVLGGRLTPEQWDALAGVAREFTPRSPLHLTTRQDVELHDLPPDGVPKAQARLAEAGLTGFGACGDTLRNVTVCPCGGLTPGTVDLGPMAWAIRRTLEEAAFILDLPRKFKIDLSCGSGDCGRPWINDLGLVATRRAGRWGFRVIGAGSLGARPAAGIALLDWVAPGDVSALVVAAVALFNAQGDREHRTRARLRHVRQRVGDDAFAAMLREGFDEEKAGRPSADVALPEAPAGFDGRVDLTFANGDVTPDAAGALAAIARRRQVEVRIAIAHQVSVFGPASSVRGAVESLPALRPPAEAQPAVIACPGTRWCSRALVDTNAMADRLRGVLSATATASVSGCPNGCAHSAVGEIGVIGRLASEGGEKVEVFDLYAGGGMGRSPKLAERVAEGLPADAAAARVAELGADAGKSESRSTRRETNPKHE